MEGFKTIESLDKWRDEKKFAPEKATVLIKEIVGYETMSPAEKIAALNALIHELAEDNNNRYVAEAVAKKLSKIIETSRHEERMAQLEIVA